MEGYEPRPLLQMPGSPAQVNCSDMVMGPNVYTISGERTAPHQTSAWCSVLRDSINTSNHPLT